MSALPRLNLPVASRSLCLGRWAVPAWWYWVVCADLVLLLPAIFAMQERLPSWLAWLGQFEPGLVWAFAATGIFGLSLVLLLHLRRNPDAATRIFGDRIELDDGKGEVRVLHWRRIEARADDQTGDIRIRTVGSGDGSYDAIHLMLRQANGRVEEEQLMCSLHPLGRPAPSFANQYALRRAFVLALQLARPELRIADEVWTLCEVHPASLRRDWRPKWFFRSSMGAMLMAVCALIMSFDLRQHPYLAIAAIVGLMLGWAIVHALLANRLFAQADDASVSARRLAALAQLAGREGLPWPPHKTGKSAAPTGARG
ncbi:hypothetical protein Q9Q94_05060 [Uliginosibacterium sp. 31-16]|uniref:hypothetical protein n=1 Tax=Uliginosibacterium sp. 31-16 TaxID=3068315 RepID=UPI00273F1268|nr:hypothetical protein [Uliginosibacterium sp. 31-16]MDP5238886.1 hypothetical protein [Uliginosibacterium sp. 31-16]